MNHEVRLAIGRRLKESRAAAKLSQLAVATELKVQRQSVSAWECGKSMPGCSEWYELGLIYGTSLDYLVYGVRTVPAENHAVMAAVFGRAGRREEAVSG